MRLLGILNLWTPFGGSRVRRASLREAVVAHLKADQAVALVVGSRVYPLVIPQSPSAIYPALAVQVIAIERPRQLDGPVSITNATVQIAAASKLFRETVAATEAVRQALDGFRGTLGAGLATIDVVESVLRTERDLSDDAADGTGRPYLRTVVEYLIRYREPRPVRLG